MILRENGRKSFNKSYFHCTYIFFIFTSFFNFKLQEKNKKNKKKNKMNKMKIFDDISLFLFAMVYKEIYHIVTLVVRAFERKQQQQ